MIVLSLFLLFLLSFVPFLLPFLQFPIANLCMLTTIEIEMQILNEGAHKPFVWKRYIDDIIFLLRQFIEEAN